MKRSPEIRLTGMQIKSEAKVRKLAAALDVIEVELGIRCCWVTFADCFVCPDIDWSRLQRTPMQRVVARILSEKGKTRRHLCAETHPPVVSKPPLILRRPRS